MKDPEIRNVTLGRFQEGRIGSALDAVAAEEPLEIRVRGESVAVTMRTPGHDRELAAGFLLSEGLIRQASEIIEIAPCGAEPATGNVLNVFLKPEAVFDLKKLSRHVFASSSCGICGKASIELVHQHFKPVASELRVNSGVLLRLPNELRQAQNSFERTGGLHAAGLFEAEGKLLVMREDVGRHNAVDKVLGHALLEGWLPLGHCALLVSGRASFEIVQKALAAAIPIIAAVSAPSSLAIELAEESNQTLVGFLREKSFNIYTHARRIIP